MKKTVTLAPGARGWTLWSDSDPFLGTLADAVAHIAPGSAVNVAVPAHALVFERLRLPATETAELGGMMRLQWEKALPVPIDEVTGGFVVLEHTPTESEVLTVAAFQNSLEKLCEPLLQRHLVPAKITACVEHVAAACPQGGVLLALFVEDDAVVALIVEDRKPGWVHVIPSLDPENLANELPQALLTAGLSGVPSNFSQVLLDGELLALKPMLQRFIEAPMASLTLPKPPFTGTLDLLPPAWKARSGQRHRTRQLRGRLIAAACVYLVAAIGAGAWLYTLKGQLRKLDVQIAQLQPQLLTEQAEQNRSTTLGPAIDPHRYGVELLFLLQKQLPAESVTLTEFNQSQQEWRVVGEAPSASLAVDYVRRIKQDPDFASWQITSAPPQMLNTERAQFSISGKL
jgi:hypothetical protein